MKVVLLVKCSLSCVEPFVANSDTLVGYWGACLVLYRYW